MLRGFVFLRSLTIVACLSLTTASASAQFFEEDFDQRDGPGPIENWTVFSEHWRVVNRTLHGLTGTRIAGIPLGEAWSWAGNPPIELPATYELSFEMEFLDRSTSRQGRHGGIMFAATGATTRRDESIRGYTLDWIDRSQSTGFHGLRLIRWDAGSNTSIGVGASNLPDPPAHWQIFIAPETIEIWGDDEFLMDVQDATYRGGFLGFWAQRDNQFIMFDNILVDNFTGFGCEDCEKISMGPGDERTGILGSSGCTQQLDDQPIELFSLTVEDIFEGTLSVTSGEFAPSLGFYNDFCDLIALNSNCPDPGTQACIGINLGPGTYTIGVSGQPGDSGGAFTINISGRSQGDPARFVRGDANSDGNINLSDGVTPLLYLFSGGDAPACMDAADANDTGSIEIADAILVFNWLFRSGTAPVPPSPTSPGYLATDCGEDLGDDALDCENPSLTCQ